MRKIRILFIFSNKKNKIINPFIKSQGDSLKKNGIDVEYFPIVGTGLRGYYRSIPILKKKLALDRFHIIHAHYGLCGIIALLSKRKEKLVVSFMGDDLIGSVNTYGTYTVASKFLARINKFFAYHIFDFNIVKSRNLFNQISKASMIEIIPNGVDFTIFYPVEKAVARKELKIKEESIIILFASNPMRLEKNFQLAQAAFEYLNLVDSELITVCDLTQSELNLYYNASDMLLLTSYHEGSPNVIKEAMACNCPIVSTDVGDVKELFDGNVGYEICSYEHTDVAKKIKKIFDYTERTKGREKVLHLEINVIANRLISIYNKLLRI
jgi:teichuronic acid biosynthesis glycosyltransferase TuaC